MIQIDTEIMLTQRLLNFKVKTLLGKYKRYT